MNLLNLLSGWRTYLAGSVLAGLGVVLLYLGDDKLGLALLANGGGLAALRSAVGKMEEVLKELHGKLDSVPKE